MNLTLGENILWSGFIALTILAGLGKADLLPW